MMTIRLYGKMGKKFGRVHRVDLATNSVAEAVQYLKANFRGVEQYLRGAKKNGVGFAVFRGKTNLTEEQLKDPCNGEDIRIAPIVLGSKNGGIFSIVLGAVLIVVGAVMNYYVPGSGAGVMGAGISMVAGGVIQMLTPRPHGLSAKDSPDSTPSYAFNGAVNTQAQGHCVPVLYGEGWVGSAVISGGMDTKDDVITPPNAGFPKDGLLGAMGHMFPNMKMPLVAQ